MADGPEEKKYRELVGRARECLAVKELIDQAIRDFLKRDEGDDDEQRA
jgi:hypothetical protein